VHEVMALLRASWLAAWSYRVARLFAFGSMVFTVIPIYFVADALQPVMAESIGAQGGQYFAFVVLGVAVYSLLTVPVSGLQGVIGSGIRTGTLEVMLGTPTPLPTLLAGLLSYNMLWAIGRALLVLLAAALLGATFAADRILPAVAITALLVAAHLPFGILGAAMILGFRTSGPLARIVLAGSGLLGGVYYPTEVIPSWIQTLSQLFPLTYGLRALRQTFLEGLPISAVLPDLGILLLYGSALAVVSGVAFAAALRYSRRAGTLAQY
jgi:ABC-2 type transport system permease protein